MRKQYTKVMDSFSTRKWNIAKFALTQIFVFLSLCAVMAQKIDSLKALLNQKSGIERYDILSELVSQYFDLDNKLCLNYANQAFNIAIRNGDTLRIVETGRIKSLIFRRLDNMDSSIILSNILLPIAKRNNYIEATKNLLNGLALAYTYKAQYDDALKYHFQSLQFREMDGDKAEISIALHNIGFIYYKMEDYDIALSYYLRSLKLKNEVNSNFDIESLLVNISLCYTYKHSFSEAKNYLDQLFSVCNGNCSESLLSDASFNLGVISFLQQKYSDAETHFLESYTLAKKLNDQRLQLDNIVYLGQVYIHTRQLKFTEKYLNEAEELIAQGTPYSLELIKIYRGLYTLYENSDDYQKVALYQQKYIQLKDSIYDQELTRNLMKVQAAYMERENNAKIQAQSEILSLNEAIIFRQRFLSAFTGVVAVLLVILAIVLNKSNRKERMTNQLLEEKVKERTTELELNSESLQRSLDERNVVFRKVTADIRSSLATIRGLCSLGLSDMQSQDRSQYIRKIDQTSEQLLRILKTTFSNAVIVEHE